MTSTAEKNHPQSPDPYEEPLASAGKAAIIVPLIIGGALVAAAIILWNTHVTKQRLAALTIIEEQVRADIRDAYRTLRNFEPTEALVHIRAAEGRLGEIKKTWAADYNGLRVAMLVIESEAEFMLDATGKAAEAERQFTEALSLMTRASGEMWQAAVLGRGRARLEQGKCREAVADLSLLMERNPNHGAAFYWRSQALSCLGEDEAARADEKRARSLDSWPPLRDFMQSKREWGRDILCSPAVRAKAAGTRQ